MYTQKTYQLKPAEASKKWLLVDAEGQTVGRLATQIADLLRGKLNPQFTRHTDSGDFVVVINAEKVKFTGAKWDAKKYHRHSGWISGLKTRTAKQQLAIEPTEILMKAVKGMLPKTTLGRKQLTKFKVFAGTEHAHSAQNPEVYTIKK